MLSSSGSQIPINCPKDILAQGGTSGSLPKVSAEIYGPFTIHVSCELLPTNNCVAQGSNRIRLAASNRPALGNLWLDGWGPREKQVIVGLSQQAYAAFQWPCRGRVQQKQDDTHL